VCQLAIIFPVGHWTQVLIVNIAEGCIWWNVRLWQHGRSVTHTITNK
jgi:hypothetical protein